MGEYIRREDVIEWFMPYAHAGESIDADVVISDIKGMKSADVAEVVRCKYCKYFGLNDENVPYCSNPFGLDDPEPNGFCNYGIGKN